MQTAIFEFRRTRREIVVPESRSTGEPPIFLVGVHRSSTTLLRLIVDSHSRIACPPESFFVAPFREVLRDEKVMEGLRAMGLSEDQVLSRLRETVSYFFELYAAARGKPRWADKTPSYVDCLDFIDALFGRDCSYVLLYRHGLDVACSKLHPNIREVRPHIAECSGDVRIGAARYCARQCEKMLAFQARHPERCHDLRYESLAADPEPVLRGLFASPGEAWEPGVLRFHESSHDSWIGLEDGKGGSSCGFRPNIGAYRRGPPEVIEGMVREAREMLARLGYEVATG